VPRLKMVKAYLKSIDKMDGYFHNVVHNYIKLFGGGLEHYKGFEKDLKEFGELKDEEQVPPSEASDTVDQVRSRASTNEIPGSSHGDPMPGVETATRSWAPINHSQPLVKPASPPIEDIKPYPSPHPFGVPGYSPNRSSNAPSLMSAGNASNGDTTPGVNSPFISNQISYPTNQSHHAVVYPSVAGHTTMAPPHHLPEEMFATTENEFARRFEDVNMPAVFNGLVQDQFMNNQWDQNPVLHPNSFHTGMWGHQNYYNKEQQMVVGISMP